MKSKILFVVCLLFGLMFINAGLNKFFQYMPMPEDMPEKLMDMFNGMMQIGWLMPLLATAEIVSGILFIIPKTRALAAVMITPIMIGILLTHFYVGEGLLLPIILTGILLWVIGENWRKYLPMLMN
ncbi:DoxX family membrane protein [Fulvivirga sp. RKSG066]|uniref:DoxX family protein n=1 Tax=Fulvivirga aurantia TaxID=2529383 RepID=UPI0012BD38CB|nr:DoxX family protein [Fulvivirga aurantia]MTI21494.1 DoxX family membrane protein [Fulvivirga aurantia]